MTSAEIVLPTFQDVLAAETRIAGHAIKTPLIQNEWLDKTLDAEVFIKPENLQRTGSFKFRGAFNVLSAIDESIREKGVVACSSGNHAQGVAEAAAIFGVPATIVMPADSPQTKIYRTKRSGAEVVLYDRMNEDRDAIALALCEKSGASFVHPYENPYVIAGQGTCGLELANDMKELGKTPDHIIVCCGGGGLTAGVTIACMDAFPNCQIHTAEPAGYDDYARSLKAGERQTNEIGSPSLCDAIVTPSPGNASFAICKDVLSDGLVVSDDEALCAVRIVFEELKLVVEPGGAVALASLLKYRERFKGKKVGIVLSGGNIDGDMFSRALSINPEKLGMI